MKRFIRTCAVAVSATALASCAGEVKPAACTDLKVGQAHAAVVILTDAGGPFITRTVQRIADDPKGTFAKKELGMEADTGIVVLATYDGQGRVTEAGAFNLGGVAREDARRRADASDQARCLKAAAAEIPPDRAGGDLLRSLPAATSLARSYVGENHRAALLAFGLGRSGGDGFDVAKADLGSEGSRAHVLSELGRVGLLPNLGAGVRVVLVAPAEGADSGITAAGIRAFASDFCRKVASAQCTAQETLA